MEADMPQTVVRKTDKIMEAPDTLATFFRLLGLSPDETTVYRTLYASGALTVLTLSRHTNLPRTRLYRITEKLVRDGVLEEIVDEHRKLYEAADVGTLQRMISARKSDASRLEELFGQVHATLTARVGRNQPETQVRFYRGRPGIRQMVWHTLRAEKEVVGFTFRPLHGVIGEDFHHDWRAQFLNKGLVLRDIYSDEYLKSKKVFGLPTADAKHFPSRYVPDSELPVTVQMDIYNDVVSNYSWHGREVFGVEIYNTDLAQFYRRLFEFIWKHAYKSPA